jgi:hypothetical protein
MMSSRFRTAAAAALVALALTMPAWAQQTESRITGVVNDTSGAVLPGVTVTATAVATGLARVVTTGTRGEYTITNLQPGRYELLVELGGFQTSERLAVLGVGEVKTVDVGLQVAAMSEIVNVQASMPVLDLSSAKIGVNVAPEEVKSLPVNGRNFANLMTLATGAASDGNGGWSSVRFNGKSNQQNYLNYDGVDGTYVFDASPGYLNVTGSQFRLQTSMESVAEFRVNSGLAPAESGLGTGGNITVITKSGGNRFTGSVFEYRRDDALDSASPFDAKKQPLALDQFGASLGGPVRRGRTFFFGSYEGLRQDTGLSFTEAVPSADARRRILAGEPTSLAGGRSPERTRAVAPLLPGFPEGGVITNNDLLSVLSVDHAATQREDAVTGRIDHTFNARHSLYARVLYSTGSLDSPDATVTARRILAKQRPRNGVVSVQSLFGSMVNEAKFGYNQPQNTARTYGPSGYPPEQVSLSGVVSSGSIDARATTGIAVSGLQIRQSSAASGGGLLLDPVSYALSDTLTWTRGRHTLKFGGEYRRLSVDMDFLGGTTVTYGSIADLIDNRPTQIQVVQDSGTLVAQQQYAIGFVQDTWRPTRKLTVDLGLRYEYYTVVREKHGDARPFIVGEGFASDANDFYAPDRNNFGPRLAATYAIDDRTALRAGYGIYYGPGQFEDRIQPIENAITRFRATSGDNPNLQYPFTLESLGNLQAIRAYTRHYPNEYAQQYGVSLQRELPGAINATIGYTGSKGRDLFLRGVTNTFELVDGRVVRPFPTISEIDFKTAGGRSDFNAVQVSATRRFRSGFTGGFQYMYATNKGTSQGSNEAATASNTFDFDTEYGRNPADIRHTANASVVYDLPFTGAFAGGWRVGGLFNARSGVPINVTIGRRDTIAIAGQTLVNIPGGNQRNTQRPDLVPGVDPYLKNGTAWLNPAAFATPLPGTFGNLPRNFLEGPGFWQADLMASKDIRFAGTHSLQLRVDVFNVTNHLNYANPPAALPNNGVPGQPFTVENAGPTFGQLTAPLNRTIGFGTARQTQISIRYLF